MFFLAQRQQNRLYCRPLHAKKTLKRLRKQSNHQLLSGNLGTLLRLIHVDCTGKLGVGTGFLFIAGTVYQQSQQSSGGSGTSAYLNEKTVLDCIILVLNFLSPLQFSLSDHGLPSKRRWFCCLYVCDFHAFHVRAVLI